jgi:3-hydroxyisobutyrate dehydrogenase-like beta-hydroxyacid dehydrogenase
MKPTVGIVGLGIMGGAMAEALRKAKYKVTGFDPSSDAQARLRKAGGTPLASTQAVAKSATVVISSLATIAALDDVVAQIVAAGNRRLVLIETSTLPLEDKERALKRLRRLGIAVLDCPISGTAVRMKERAWTIYVSGDEKALKKVSPMLAVFADNVPYVGVFGNGTRMKFLANHLAAILNVASAESLTFARRMGLDPQQVLDLLGPSPVVGTGVLRLRGKFMIARNYTPPTMKVEVWQKDMKVIGEMARGLHCPTPLFDASAPIYTAAMGQGLAQSDTASVCEVLSNMAGLKKPKRKSK